MPRRPSPPNIMLGLIPRAASCIRTRLGRAFVRTSNTEVAGSAGVPVQAPDVAVLDIGVFKELHVTLGSDIDRVRNVYAKFLDSAAKRVDELRQQPQAIAASVKTLHALKGSAGMVGANRLAALCARLQEATTDSSSPAVAIDEVERELAAFHEVLRSQLDSLPGMEAASR